MSKREKQRDFLNQVMATHRDFTEFHKNKRLAIKKRAQQAKQFLDNIEKKDLQEKEKKERERIQLLKQNNMEGYLKMINEAKCARLVEFMNQTDEFLKEIEEKISVQKEVTQQILRHQDEIIKEENDIQMEGEEKELSEENGNGIKKSLIHIEEEKDEKEREKVSNSKNYYLTAHSMLEEIKVQPKMLKHGNLKPYQLIGLQWLVSLYVNNLNGILADEMGLGKTIQTIALLCYLIERKHNNGPFLIVAPLSTISNWVLEFNKWAPEVKVVVYKGAPNYRKSIAYQLKNDRNNIFNTVLDKNMVKFVDLLELLEAAGELLRHSNLYIILDSIEDLKHLDAQFKFKKYFSKLIAICKNLDIKLILISNFDLKNSELFPEHDYLDSFIQLQTPSMCTREVIDKTFGLNKNILDSLSEYCTNYAIGNYNSNIVNMNKLIISMHYFFEDIKKTDFYSSLKSRMTNFIKSQMINELYINHQACSSMTKTE